MTRGLKVILTVAGLVAATSLWVFWPAARADQIALIGDHAPEWQARLGLPSGSPENPALTLVLVDDWIKMNYLGPIQAICGPACGENAFVVRTVEVRPGGSHKLVVVHIGAWVDETLPDDCLETVLRQEIAGADNLPDCAQAQGPLTTQYLLPLGLGHV